jgi:nicotinamidase-related amidase
MPNDNSIKPQSDQVRLGDGRYAWKVSSNHVDLSMPPAIPRVIDLKAQPQELSLDLSRTAIVIVDLQNDFLSPGGWADSVGADLTKGQAPVKRLKGLLPVLRTAQVPVIWVSWGHRPDRANVPPTTLYVFNPDGKGIGIGGALPDAKGHLLQKDSWSSQVVEDVGQLSDDIMIDKFRISGFWDTQLDSVLRNFDIKTVLFGGVNTDQCVLHTLADAHFLGYNCILLEDCCGTTSPSYCVDAVLFNVKMCFGFVSNSTDVISAVSA